MWKLTKTNLDSVEEKYFGNYYLAKLLFDCLKLSQSESEFTLCEVEVVDLVTLNYEPIKVAVEFSDWTLKRIVFLIELDSETNLYFESDVEFTLNDDLVAEFTVERFNYFQLMNDSIGFDDENAQLDDFNKDHLKSICEHTLYDLDFWNEEIREYIENYERPEIDDI